MWSGRGVNNSTVRKEEEPAALQGARYKFDNLSVASRGLVRPDVTWICTSLYECCCCIWQWLMILSTQSHRLQCTVTSETGGSVSGSGGMLHEPSQLYASGSWVSRATACQVIMRETLASHLLVIPCLRFACQCCAELIPMVCKKAGSGTKIRSFPSDTISMLDGNPSTNACRY
jgi:hypothetical protein